MKLDIAAEMKRLGVHKVVLMEADQLVPHDTVHIYLHEWQTLNEIGQGRDLQTALNDALAKLPTRKAA